MIQFILTINFVNETSIYTFEHQNVHTGTVLSDIRGTSSKQDT